MVLVATAVLAGLLGGPLAAPQVASAKPGPIRQPTSATVTADSLPTAQINGVVWSQVVAGDRVFAGGEFTSTRPAGAALGTDESPRHNLMSYSLSTGVATSFAPDLDGVVKAVVLSADQTTLYVGGQFNRVNGLRRDGFAAFRVGTGELLPLAPSLNATVNAIVSIGRVVYLGGIFNRVNGVPRSRLAAVNVDTGGLTAWAPAADARVHALVATPDRTAIVVAGSFATLGGRPALGMGSVSASTGAPRAWAINRVVKNHGENSAVLTLAADQNTIYGGGYAFGGGNFEGVFAADPTTGNVRWLQDCHGDTYDVAPIGEQVYSAGHAHFCGNIGGFPDTKPRTAYYHALAVTKQAAGTVGPNTQPGLRYGDFRGRPAPSLYNWFPALAAGTYTGLSQAAWSVTGNASYLTMGGEFPRVNGRPQQGLARFAVPDLAPNRQGPRVTAAATTPTVAVQGTRVALRWQTNWDRDDQVLTYDVLRNGVVIRTIPATSHFWRRPLMHHLDRSGTPGASYRYQIRVRDPHGNRVTSPAVAASYPSDDAYARRILADRAAHQWRLGSASGQTGDPDRAGGLPMSASSGVTFGAPGAFRVDADTAATFDGSTAAVARTQPGAQPAAAVSIEAWLKTTSSSGGALVGFGAGADATPSVAGLRQVHLDAEGRVRFSVRGSGASAAVTVTSPQSVNDGAWHSVVAVQHASGIRLYVDGAEVATSAGPSPVPALTSRWVLGGATPLDLPARVAGRYTGSLDDVSVFNSALTARQAYEHHRLGAPRFRVVGVAPGR